MEETRPVQGIPLEELMPATEKRKEVIRQVIKPLLKEAGFRTKGNRWKKELEDGWLLVRLVNGSYSTKRQCYFELYFGAYTKERMGDADPFHFWRTGIDLNQSDFLPYFGCFHPYCHPVPQWYWISSYYDTDTGLPVGGTMESLFDQLREDLETYILPQLAQIKKVSDWEQLYRKKENDRNTSKDIALIGYYTWVEMGYLPEQLKEQQKRDNLSDEEILSHLDWWIEMKAKQGRPACKDIRERIARALQ